MNRDELLQLVGESLQATEGYLLSSIRSDRTRRTELLAMLDVLPLLATDLINNLKEHLDAK